MAITFQLFPSQAQDTSTQSWVDRQIRMRLTWRERTGAWYVDLFELDDTPIVFGRRISPSFFPLLGLGFEGESLPRDQVLFVAGPTDPYERDTLADTLVVSLVSQSEIDEFLTDPETFTTFVELT
jgi:hypothetical protein